MKTITYSKASILSNSMFNLTKLIKENYEKGTFISKEYLQCFDLSETSKKTFYSYDPKYGQQTYNIEESAAVNLITYLPFNYYKEYVTFDWIFYGSATNSLAEICLYNKKFEILKEILKIGEIYISNSFTNDNKNNNNDNNNDTRKNIEEYERHFLSHLTNVARITSSSFYTSKENFESYKEIFDMAIQQSFFLRNEREQRFNKKKKIVPYHPKEWFKHLSYLSSYNKGGTTSFINSLFENPEAIIFLKEISSDPIYKDLIFTVDNIKLSLQNGNQKAFDFLKTHISIDTVDFQDIIKKLLNKWTENELDIYNSKTSYHRESSKDEFLYKILTILETEIKDFSFLSNEDIQYLSLVSDEKTLKKIINMFPETLDIKLNNMPLNEFLLSFYTLKEFMEKNEYHFNLKSHNQTYPTPELKIASNFSQIIPFENYNNIMSNSIKENLFTFFDYLVDKKKQPLDIEKIKIEYNYTELTNLLEPQKNIEKKIKL